MGDMLSSSPKTWVLALAGFSSTAGMVSQGDGEESLTGSGDRSGTARGLTPDGSDGREEAPDLGGEASTRSGPSSWFGRPAAATPKSRLILE